jgi:butyrate kinase
MAYQVGKEIGMCAAVLKGNVDAVVITGGLAFDGRLTGWISEMVSFISRVIIYPGEDEMSALAAGALRVLEGKEEALSYQ